MAMGLAGNKTVSRGRGGALVIVYRAVVCAALALLFAPGVNPIRFSGLISGNVSLFTCVVSRGAVLTPFTRALMRGWIDAGLLNLVYFCGFAMALAVAAMAVGGCVSLGNRPLRRLGCRASLAGSAVGLFVSLALRIVAGRFAALEESSRVDPLVPVGMLVFTAVFAIAAAMSAAALLSQDVRRPRGSVQAEAAEPPAMPAKYSLFLMALPFVALIVVFSYMPLLGWRYAFYDYKPGYALTADRFVGLKWFAYLFQNAATKADIARVMRNTLAMSGIGIATSWLPMAFAVFLTEMNSAAPRKLVQGITTIPNFISWVLVYAVAFALFSTEGFVNSTLMSLGLIAQGGNALMSGANIWLKMWLWGVWKGLGWSAIIYVASISGIDQQLYEAASIDGATRFGKMRHITAPGLTPTYFVLLLLSIANMLSNGMDQYLVFRNQMNKQTIEVLDLYVYTLGLASGGNSNISLATVVGMFKSLVSVTLLFVANRASFLIRGESII
ncbi:MAG: ABC transporter permease subunit [Oscillospiraceae bacterium]|jgi:putative aldouronate transport system permease protein|nr:ABC transporter permease subunit [Oscillospiraceae bacterium]